MDEMDHRKGKANCKTWMSLKEHVAHTGIGITLSNHVSLHVYCTWHLCHHAVPLNSMLNLSLFPWLGSLIPSHIHTSQPHIFPGCLRSVQIWGSQHTPNWESVCMQSFAVLDGWPGPFQTAESSGRIQKDEPIPQLRWNSGIYCDRWRGYLVTTCCFFRLCKWIKSKNLTIMIWFFISCPPLYRCVFWWFWGSCPG